MTRRDFELIARVLRESIIGRPAPMDEDGRRRIAEAFADELAHTNPAFDRARFLKACGVQS